MIRKNRILMLLTAALLCGGCVRELDGIDWSDDHSFTFTLWQPTVSWEQKVTVFATLDGYDGLPEFTRCGVCYGTMSEPTVTTGTVCNATLANNSFTTTFDYPGGEKIYVRAFAEYAYGVIYADEVMEVRPLRPYSQLKLSDFTPLSTAGFDSIPDPHFTDWIKARHYGITNIKSMLVTERDPTPQGNMWYHNFHINCNNQDYPQIHTHDGESLSLNDHFNICGGEYYGFEGRWNGTDALFDDYTVGYTAHVYASSFYDCKVKSTRTNLGWLLEFSSPVCLTVVEFDVDLRKVYYSTE